jgi:hypothetical protein
VLARFLPDDARSVVEPPTLGALSMASKKPVVKELGRKPVQPKESGSVKGGRSGRLAANHNQTLR